MEQTKRGFKFWPRSRPVKEGVAYAFSTGHCGLDYLTDFDGSFWSPVNPRPGKEPPEFFINEDQGTMTLVAERRAVYESSSGSEVKLRRHPGALVLRGLCA